MAYWHKDLNLKHAIHLLKSRNWLDMKVKVQEHVLHFLRSNGYKFESSKIGY